MRLVAGLTIGTLAVCATAASADPVEEAMKENIRLFDELVTCSSKPNFQQHGISTNGPCGDWITRVRVAIDRQPGRDIFFAGAGCVAGELQTAANGLVFGDRQRFNYVRGLIDECRQMVGR